MPNPPLRDSPMVRFLGFMLAIYTIPFAILTAWVGDHLASKPWILAMSIPGHQLTWAFLFGMGGIISIAALISRRHNLIALGQLFTALGCGGLAFLFLVGPLYGPGLFTLGYWPWLFWMSIAVLLGVINIKDNVRW
jgi:hypothetical protein